MYSYRVEMALRAATVLHKGQVRKGSLPVPYVSHLFAVGLLVLDYTDSEDALIGALLHDTLEDTDYTPEELEEDFGGRVREIVEALTEPQPTETKKVGWREKKDQYSRQLKQAPEEALVIAAADKIHNMRSIVEEYYNEHHRFVADFGGGLDERIVAYQEIANVLNSRLKNAILHEFNHVFTEYKTFIENVRQAKEHPEEI